MQILEQFFRYLRSEKRLSPSTVLSYQTDINQFRTFLSEDGGGADLGSASESDIRSWIIYLMDSGLSPRSVHRKISGLRRFYRYAVLSGQLTENPAALVVLPRVSKPLPVYLEESSLEALFSSDLFSHDFFGMQDRLILELLYGTGLRLSELVSLQDSDLDLSRCQLRVSGKGRKDRLVPFPQNLAAVIRIHLKYRREAFPELDGGALFLTNAGKKIYPKFVYRLVKKYLGYVTTIGKRSPHVLRHSYATHLLNRGADLNAIKELLGHSSLAATQVYTHTDLSKLKTIHRKAHPRAHPEAGD